MVALAYNRSVRRILVALTVLACVAAAYAGESWEPRGGLDDPSPAEVRGRDAFRAEVCFTCHGEHARANVTGLERPGPVRSEDWYLAHLYDPRLVHPRSPMPGWKRLFDPPPFTTATEVAELIAQFDRDGDGRVSFARDVRPDWAEKQQLVSRMADLDLYGVRVPPSSALQSVSGEELWPDAEDPYVDRFVAGEEDADGILSLRDARPVPQQRALDLVRYVQAVDPPAVPKDEIDEAALKVLTEIGGRLITRPGQHGRVRARLKGPEVVPPKVVREGARLYARHCAACHGETGRGNGPASRFLDAPPTDLVRGVYKYRSTLPGRGALLTDLYRTIRRGLPGSGMPGMASLPPSQVWALALHVQALGTKAPKAASPVEVPPLPTLTLKAEDDLETYERFVARGKAVYVSLDCARCHGTTGRGDGPDAVVEWSDGRQIRARDFKPRDRRDMPTLRMRGGATPGALWRTVMAGLDTKGMPGVHQIFQEAARARGGKGTKQRLRPPLKDPALFAVGVTASEDGPYVEHLDELYVNVGNAKPGGLARFGDDWSLVLYLLHMMRTEDEVKRGVMAWPKIEVAK